MLTQDFNPSLRSHTHWQAAQANALTKACQRVRLSNRTTDREKNEQKEALGGNKVLSKWRQKCYYETFVLNSTAVILLKFSANIPPLRQYPNVVAYVEGFSIKWNRHPKVDVLTKNNPN